MAPKPFVCNVKVRDGRRAEVIRSAFSAYQQEVTFPVKKSIQVRSDNLSRKSVSYMYKAYRQGLFLSWSLRCIASRRDLVTVGNIGKVLLQLYILIIEGILGSNKFDFLRVCPRNTTRLQPLPSRSCQFRTIALLRVDLLLGEVFI